MDPEEVEFLEDLLMAAFEDTQKKIQAMTQEAYGEITGGMNIPGLFG